MAKNNSEKTDIFSLEWNQDFTCFCCGTEKGFYVYNTDPFKERFARDFSAGVGVVEMLFRCNLLALVGGGNNPKFAADKVVIWDDFQNKSIAELEFRTPVKAVKLRKDKIVVVLDSKVYVYNFADLKVAAQYDTNNVQGLVAITPADEFVLAFPGKQLGTIVIPAEDEKQTKIIEAHNNAISCIALTQDGKYVATASEKGTLIRVFDTKTGEKVKEVRRGKESTEILSIAFSKNSKWLAISSAKGSIHVWGLAGTMEQTSKEEDKTKGFSVPFVKDLVPQSWRPEWSFAQFHIPETDAIVAFVPDKENYLAVVSKSGKYYRYSFDVEKGGEAKCEQTIKFLETESK